TLRTRATPARARASTKVEEGRPAAVATFPQHPIQREVRAMSVHKGSPADYWKANLRLVGILLAIWFVCSYGFGILFKDALDSISFFGTPLGFWFAQQGSIYIFLVLIAVYVRGMNALDRKFDVHED